MKNPSHFKALALFSGGLDSILAVKLIQSQGIEVEAVVFVSPFFNEKNAEKSAKMLGIKLHKIDITDKIIEILKNPKYGFGKNLNPCIDCHLLMIKEASKLMKTIGADFLITGEVVGERPKSQNYKALKIIEEESGLKGKLLRPLSAKRLKLTEIEAKGIIDRAKLLGIAGKSRKPQMELAKLMGIKEYPTPAGGCLLTVPTFSDRLRISLKIGNLRPDEIEILKYGRHFLTENQIKIIVGREEFENEKLFNLADNLHYIFELKDAPGPLTILESYEPTYDEIIKSAALTARYSKLRDYTEVKVKYYQKIKPDKIKEVLVVPQNYKELGLTLI